MAAKARVVAWLGGFDIGAEPLKYTCESTGPYHMPLIKAWEGSPSIINPLLANPSRRKTDKLDARLLSYHAITGLWPESHLPGEAISVLKLIMRARKTAKRQRLRASNRILNIMTTLGYPVSIYGPPRTPQARAMIEDLARGGTPKIAGLPPTPVHPEVGKLIIRSYNDLDIEDYQERACLKAAEAHLKAVMLPFGGTPEWTAPGGVVIGTLCTVPGIGSITALTWITAVCDPRRFKGSKAIAAFAGCDPSLKVSAGKVTAHVRRGGNKELHEALVNAAMGLVNRASEPLGRWGARLAAKPGKGQWRKAVGAVARRLAIGLYYVHMTGQPFSYDKYNLDIDVKIPDMQLADSGLPARVIGNLARHGITTADELLKRYSTDLGKTKGGLFLRGQVVGRSRKLLEGGARYAYTIATGAVQYKVTIWGEHDYFKLFENVCIEVVVHCYVNSKGNPMFQLTKPNGLQGDEEAF